MGVYYPIFINLKGRNCLIVGGGKVAERKVKLLIDCGAKVTVVSPEITKTLSAYCLKKKIKHNKRLFRGSDLDGQFLVFGATNDPKINDEVSRKARKNNILVNIADFPDSCDFILPSVMNRGDLQIAISTGAKSPALAAKIKKELYEIYGKEYKEFLKLLSSLRKKILRKIRNPEKRKMIFRSLVESDIISSIKKNKKKEAIYKAKIIIDEKG